MRTALLLPSGQNLTVSLPLVLSTQNSLSTMNELLAKLIADLVSQNSFPGLDCVINLKGGRFELIFTGGVKFTVSVE